MSFGFMLSLDDSVVYRKLLNNLDSIKLHATLTGAKSITSKKLFFKKKEKEFLLKEFSDTDEGEAVMGNKNKKAIEKTTFNLMKKDYRRILRSCHGRGMSRELEDNIECLE